MNKGRRYKKDKKTLNVFILIASIFVFLFVCIIIINSKEEDGSAYVEENEKVMETISKEEPVVEPKEDEEIKELVENLMKNQGLDASTIKMPIAMLYYDKIRDGELTLEDTITYTSDCYEAGAGTTAYTYSVGSKVPINFLLEQCIVNSDNTAINILIKNLGYENCKKQIADYSSVELDEEFYSSNIITAKYAYDIVNHLYENLEDYSELLEYLKISSNGQYLKKYIEDYDVAHKYGSYNGYVHDYGIVFGETNYLIGIFTKNVSNADELIANTSLKIFNEVNESYKVLNVNN